jgi:hypothetical protein
MASAGVPGRVSPAENLGNGLDAELLELGLRDEHYGGSTVVDGGGVGGRDGTAVGNEDGTDRLQLVDVQVLDLLVPVDLDRGLATATAHLDGRNLGENAGLGGGLGLLVCVDGVLILHLAGQAVLLATELALHAHELLLAVCVTETVLLHAVDEGGVAVLDTGAEVGEVVWCVGHALSATSHDDGGVAGHDGLGTEDDGLHARSADLVDGCADDAFRETSVDRALPGRGLAETESKTALGGHRWRGLCC